MTNKSISASFYYNHDVDKLRITFNQDIQWIDFDRANARLFLAELEGFLARPVPRQARVLRLVASSPDEPLKPNERERDCEAGDEGEPTWHRCT